MAINTINGTSIKHPTKFAEAIVSASKTRKASFYGLFASATLAKAAFLTEAQAVYDTLGKAAESLSNIKKWRGFASNLKKIASSEAVFDEADVKRLKELHSDFLMKIATKVARGAELGATIDALVAEEEAKKEAKKNGKKPETGGDSPAPQKAAISQTIEVDKETSDNYAQMGKKELVKAIEGEIAQLKLLLDKQSEGSLKAIASLLATVNLKLKGLK